MNLPITQSRLEMLGDSVCFRDARARSRRPSLSVVPGAGDLAVRGDFTVIQRFGIAPDEGRVFVETSGDTNPIHTEGTVVPGAMTAARFLLLPEILLPGLRTTSLRVKFRAFAHYGRPGTNVFTIRLPAAHDAARQVSIASRSFQRGVLVAEASIAARLDPVGPLSGATPSGASLSGASLSGASLSGASLSGQSAVIRAFLASLRVDPTRYLDALGLYYPRAFLASLPSGAMVRHGGAGGAGGLLNVLDLEFPEEETPSLSGDAAPVAEVETTRPRSNFRRILARVGDGIRTYCKGYATVLAALVRDVQGAPAAEPLGPAAR